jgi:hypothetical protein
LLFFLFLAFLLLQLFFYQCSLDYGLSLYHENCTFTFHLFYQLKMYSEISSY